MFTTAFQNGPPIGVPISVGGKPILWRAQAKNLGVIFEYTLSPPLVLYCVRNPVHCCYKMISIIYSFLTNPPHCHGPSYLCFFPGWLNTWVSLLLALLPLVYSQHICYNLLKHVPVYVTPLIKLSVPAPYYSKIFSMSYKVLRNHGPHDLTSSLLLSFLPTSLQPKTR